MSFYTDLDAAVASIVQAGLFGTATITTVVKAYNQTTDRTVETTTTATIDAITLEEKVMATNGVLTTQTVAYTRQPVSINDRLTIGSKTSNVVSISPINPAATLPLLYRVVLS